MKKIICILFLSMFAFSAFARIYRGVQLDIATGEKFFDLFFTARKKKLPDSWIEKKYFDYLINEKKVLDSYTYDFGRFWKACGFSFMGVYDLDGKGGTIQQTYGEKKTFVINTFKRDYFKTHSITKKETIKKGNRTKVKTTEETKQELLDIHISVYYEELPVYDVSGTIEQELFIDYKPNTIPSSWSTAVKIKSNGSYKIKLRYNLKGIISLDDEDGILGGIKYTNPKVVSFEPQGTYYEIYDSVYGSVYGGYTNIFIFSKYKTNCKTGDDMLFEGTYQKDTNNASVKFIFDGKYDVATVDGSCSGDAMFDTRIFGQIRGSGVYPCNTTFTTGGLNNQPLLDFVVEEGTKTYTSDKLKDSFSFTIDYDYASDPDQMNGWFPLHDESLYQAKTTQTLILTRLPPMKFSSDALPE